MPLFDYAENRYFLTCAHCGETSEFFEDRRGVNACGWEIHNDAVYCSWECAYEDCECEECNRCEECDCSPCECNDDNVRYPECGCTACRNGQRNECAMNEKTEV